MSFFQFCDKLRGFVGESKVILHIEVVRRMYYENRTVDEVARAIKSVYKVTEDFSK